MRVTIGGVTVRPFLPATFMDRVRDWWHRPKPSARVLFDHGAWGDAIDCTGVLPGQTYGSVFGWQTPLPRKGDVVVVRMRSGALGSFVFTDVRPVGDPRDMFRATVYRYGDAIAAAEPGAP